MNMLLISQFWCWKFNKPGNLSLASAAYRLEIKHDFENSVLLFSRHEYENYIKIKLTMIKYLKALTIDYLSKIYFSWTKDKQKALPVCYVF